MVENARKPSSYIYLLCLMHPHSSLAVPKTFEVARKPSPDGSIKAKQALAVWDLDPNCNYTVRVNSIDATQDDAKSSRSKGIHFTQRVSDFRSVLCSCRRHTFCVCEKFAGGGGGGGGAVLLWNPVCLVLEGEKWLIFCFAFCSLFIWCKLGTKDIQCIWWCMESSLICLLPSLYVLNFCSCYCCVLLDSLRRSRSLPEIYIAHSG